MRFYPTTRIRYSVCENPGQLQMAISRKRKEISETRWSQNNQKQISVKNQIRKFWISEIFFISLFAVLEFRYGQMYFSKAPNSIFLVYLSRSPARGPRLLVQHENKQLQIDCGHPGTRLPQKLNMS